MNAYDVEEDIDRVDVAEFLDVLAANKVLEFLSTPPRTRNITNKLFEKYNGGY